MIFAAKQNYEILGDPVVRLEGAITENVVFGDGNDYTVPMAIWLFTVTVPEVENATVTVATNGEEAVDFTGGELVVLSNTTVTVEYAADEGWALQGETSFAATVEAVGLDEATGTAILTVPATAEKGFMILKSKGADPSNRSGRPDTADVQRD